MKISQDRVNEIKSFINTHKESKIYLCVDSQRQKKNKVKIACVLVVHYEGNRGGKIFEFIEHRTIKDGNLSKPYNRMMSEVEVIIDLYTIFEDVLYDKDFSVHLDIAKDKNKGSSIAYGSAYGMITGIIGVEPVFKPDAWCSSTVADKFSK